MDVGNSLNPAIDIGATWTRGPQQAEPNKKMATFPMKKWWFSIEIIENIDIETCPENEVTDSVEMHVPEKPRCAGFLSSCLLVIYKLLKYIGVKIQCLKDTWFIFEIYWRVYDRRGLFRMSLRAKSVLARESLSPRWNHALQILTEILFFRPVAQPSTQSCFVFSSVYMSFTDVIWFLLLLSN